MKALLAICLLTLSFGVKAQDVLPPAPASEQQPITNTQLSKNLTTQAWGIMAGSAVFGALMIADRTKTEMSYAGYTVLSTGMALGLTWHFMAKEARMKSDMRTASLHQ